MTQTCSAQTVNAAPRYDIYMGIHKALRAFMTETLMALGRMDCDAAVDVAIALAQVRELLHACEGHLEHENHFVHAAMEKRRPGSSARIVDEHIEHRHEIERLRAMVACVETATDAERRVSALNLYREFALFVASNFEHMQREESDHNKVLWSAYSDAELNQVEAELKASIPPRDMAIIMRWLLCANDHAFRVVTLSGMREHAPSAVFEMTLGLARAHLSERDWQKVACALELSQAA